MSSIAIAFSYTTDPLVVAALGGFHVIPVNDAHERLAEAIVVPPSNIPTSVNPLFVSIPSSATQIEVVPVDAHGYEGQTTYLPVQQSGLPHHVVIDGVEYVPRGASQ